MKVEPDTHLKMTLEGYHSTLLHVPVRFGRWDELSESRFEGNPDYLPVSWVMHHYGRAVAFAAMGREDDANKAAEEFAARAVPFRPSMGSSTILPTIFLQWVKP